MKVLQINTVAQTGSISRIMEGIAECCLQNGHEVYIAYGRGKEGKKAVYHKFTNNINVASHVMQNFFLGESGFGSYKDTEKFLDWINQIKPDVIHLHNLHGFYINVELLFEYIKKENIPVVWTFHDCWPFTGHCAYYDQIDCDKWKTHCEACKIHRSAYPYALFKDNSYEAYERKKKAFNDVDDLNIVTPSFWLAEQVKESFLKTYPVKVIPNGIDAGIFMPLNDNSLKKKYGITDDKIVVLGVANHWESRKGLRYFLQLAEDLSDKFIIVLVGLTKYQQNSINKKYAGKIVSMLRTNNVEELVEIYNCADIFVNPTMEDNFPTTNLEALSCGVPVFTFKTGGSAECINSKCGMAIEKGNYKQLLQNIINFEKNTFSIVECREQAEKYNKREQYQKYIGLYERTAKNENEII